MTRWQFLKKHWVMTSIGTAILLGALITLIYAVVTGEGDEGFLEGENHSPLVWDRSSLPVNCFYNQELNDQLSSLIKAREEINKEVGYLMGPCQPWIIGGPFPVKPIKHTTLIDVGNAMDPNESGVIITSPFDKEHGGMTELFTDKDTKKLYGAIIHIREDLPQVEWTRVYLHEMLHALGLGHDRLPSSIMYPTLVDRPSKLSKRDIERLRKAYLK